jgi:hypothetical protein
MSLRQTVAAPFRQRGVDRLRESEFVVVLSLDLEWFTAEQAQRLVDVAASEGLLAREDDAVVATFDPAGVDLPDDFAPDEAVLQQRSTFERTLAAIVENGTDKQTAVADINRLQADLDVTVEAAAVLYARRRGLDVTGLAERAREEL